MIGVCWQTYQDTDPAKASQLLETIKMLFLMLGGLGVIISTYFNIWQSLETAELLKDQIRRTQIENTYSIIEKWDDDALFAARKFTRELKARQRTLSPDDSRYKGTYIGNHNKDMAYHNGTVWPWLLGSFIKAFVKVRKNNPEDRKYAYMNFIKPMLEVYDEKWDGSIYEIFDGSPIYAPRGCITQAWSVAEILRTWVEDIENIPPNFEKIFYSPKIRV